MRNRLDVRHRLAERSLDLMTRISESQMLCFMCVFCRCVIVASVVGAVRMGQSCHERAIMTHERKRMAAPRRAVTDEASVAASVDRLRRTAGRAAGLGRAAWRGAGAAVRRGVGGCWAAAWAGSCWAGSRRGLAGAGQGAAAGCWAGSCGGELPAGSCGRQGSSELLRCACLSFGLQWWTSKKTAGKHPRQ